MADYEVLSHEAVEYLCSLIRSMSSVSDGIDDINISTDKTFSSYKIDKIIKQCLKDGKEFSEQVCSALIKLTCQKTTIKPTLENSEVNVIYLYSNDGNAPFEQYLKISETELIDMGSTSISLDNFYDKETIDDNFVLKTDFEDLKNSFNYLINNTEIINDDSNSATETWSSDKIKSYVDNNKWMYVSEESDKYNNSQGLNVTSYFTICGNQMTIFAIQRASNDGKTIGIKYPLPFKELPTITKTYGTPAGIEKTTKNSLTEWSYDQNYGSQKQNEMHFMIQGII